MKKCLQVRINLTYTFTDFNNKNSTYKDINFRDMNYRKINWHRLQKLFF